jgi:hypothetical protein
LSTALVALLAALPTGSAVAAPAAPSVTTIPVVESLPARDLEEVLSTLPVGALNTTQLSELIAKLPGIEGLVPSLGLGGLTNLKTALSAAITDLAGKGATLRQLLEPAGLPSTLGTELGKLLPLLGTLLGGNPTTKLTEALGSKTPTELVDELLRAVTEPADLSQLLSEIAAGLSLTAPKTLLQSLLGTTMTGGFGLTTVEGAATALDTSTASLTHALEPVTKEADLPATTQALTAPLATGKLLGVINGVKGLTAGLLGSESKETSKETNSEGGKEHTDDKETTTTQETGGSGGGSGNSGGASGNPGGTTVVVNPLTEPGVTSPATIAQALGRLKIVSHRVRGRIATLVMQVPAAGKLTLSGSGVRAMNRQADRPERITLRVTLSRAGASSLRRHHRLHVRLLASFKPSSRPSSSAAVTVTFA